MTSSLIGRTLGKYKIIDDLGQGGMATVYIGYQENVDRKVAVKVLPPHPGLDASFRERFQLEARTIARLQHPHILPLYDYGQEEDVFYFVMSYVDGGSLEDKIGSTTLSLRETEKILREISGALDYAHRQGIIHRDIKPANILLASEGFSLLADFGIAKLAEGSGVDLTGTGVVGTPAYMAPEQAQGLPIDARADVYSLGVVAYYMLTGRQPFTAATPMQVIMKVMQEPPVNILQVKADLPEPLGAVMDRVLSKDPDERYQTASEFAEAFSAAIHDADELEAVQKMMPLDPDATEAKTVAPVMPTQASSGAANAPTSVNPQAANDSQTIVVQSGTNPLVLLLGVAIIAAALVVVALIVVSGGDEDDGTSTVVDNEPTVAEQQEPDDPTPEPEPTVPTISDVETFGRVSYSTRENLGDGVTVNVEGLTPLPSGTTYVAWLVNTESGETLNLGDIAIDGFGEGARPFTDEEGRTLPGIYNAVWITAEEDVAAAEPAGEIAYSSIVPAVVTDALRQILLESEDGLSGGSLLDGAQTESRIAAQHAGLASRAGSVSGMHSHAEHTINILNGTEDDYNGNGRGENPGRGIGMYFFVERMSSLIDAILTSEDVPAFVKAEAELTRVCLENAEIRAERVEELELELLAEQDDIANVEEQATESLRIAEELNAGFDLNENGQIEPFEGECGFDQIEVFGLFMASVQLEAGDITGG